MVYLVLSFLYESWLLPLAVILVVPLGILVWLHSSRGSESITTRMFKSCRADHCLGQQERDLDCRVRPRTASGRQIDSRRSHTGGQVALPADSDDIVRIYSGCLATGIRHRRSRRQPSRAGHRSLRWHAQFDHPRSLLYASILRRLSVVERKVDCIQFSANHADQQSLGLRANGLAWTSMRPNMATAHSFTRSDTQGDCMM